MFPGGYPRVYQQQISPNDPYQNYIQTYAERDVRQIKSITDLGAFQRFLKMCTYRAGQLVNFSEITNNYGISHNTASAWMSLLETSYIAFLLKPHHKNFNKRLVKIPKVYFYDTGLLCHLLDIKQSEQVVIHPNRGHIYENFVITELMKQSYNQGERPNLYFWRDKTEYEIDCLIESGTHLIPIEIKSGKTLTSDYFTGLKYWLKLTEQEKQLSYLVYAGDQTQRHHHTHILDWKEIPSIHPLGKD